MKYVDYTKDIQDSKTRRSVHELAENFKLKQRCFTLRMDNCTTLSAAATAVFACVPWTGDITKIFCVGTMDASGGDALSFSFGINNLVMTGNIITVTTGATLGKIHGYVDPTSSVAVDVSGGQVFYAKNAAVASGPAGQTYFFTVVVDIKE